LKRVGRKLQKLFFSTIKNVASVSPIPCKVFEDYETSSTLSKILMKKVKFKYEAIPSNFEAHNRYLKSFNWKLETNENLMWPVIESNGVKMYIGEWSSDFNHAKGIIFLQCTLGALINFGRE
jgi:hypothetical protein